MDAHKCKASILLLVVWRRFLDLFYKALVIIVNDDLCSIFQKIYISPKTAESSLWCSKSRMDIFLRIAVVQFQKIRYIHRRTLVSEKQGKSEHQQKYNSEKNET